MYAAGRGVPRDDEQAAIRRCKAAEHGDDFLAFWGQQAMDRILAAQPLKVPTMLVHGLWDQEDIYGAPAVHRAIEPKDAGNDMVFFVAGPWYHGQQIGDGSALGAIRFDSDTALTFRRDVLTDYNQNAKGRTVAGAYSIRPKPDARASAPLTWDEVEECDPADFTLATMPERFAKAGDRHRGIDDLAGSLEPLLDLSARQEREGQGDAPWPPHFRKQTGEPPRVQPSRRKAAARRR